MPQHSPIFISRLLVYFFKIFNELLHLASHVLMPCIHAESKKHAGKYCESFMPFHIPVSLLWQFSVLFETVFQILPVFLSL